MMYAGVAGTLLFTAGGVRWEPPMGRAAAHHGHPKPEDHISDSPGKLGATFLPYTRIIRLMGGQHAETPLHAPESSSASSVLRGT